ncbi:hypothetical protein K4L44_13090 [Halosquirtibacter laminarini]|uniref:Uncharacterized protein n=1 Tax=Halosquirtibacter laminarini TaxID=3374600 RepID=A0AC61NM58_9BACT|nr:hypothetical protein K4L44_13090 [Prolixibacteraceae bacterium]
MSRIICFVFLIGVLFSCNSDHRNVSVENTQTIDSITHLEDVVTPTLTDPVKSLFGDIHKNEHKAVLFFAQQVLGVENERVNDLNVILSDFLNDSTVQKAYIAVGKINQISPLDDSIKKCFHYFNYYFPNSPLPHIYTLVSGFNNSILYSKDELGVSLEMYLGSDCPYYDMLAIPKYKHKLMIRERIPLDIMEFWLRVQYPMSIKKRRLIDYLIYEGKILYALTYIFPDKDIFFSIGYNKDQWRWCETSEAAMWNYLVDQKMLFDTNQLLVRKMVGPSPFTNFFTTKSPGQCGRWIGYRLIESYMKKNPGVTIQKLFEMKDSSKILSHTGYAPS